MALDVSSQLWSPEKRPALFSQASSTLFITGNLVWRLRFSPFPLPTLAPGLMRLRSWVCVQPKCPQTCDFAAQELALPNYNFLGSEITEDGDCSHEIKRRLLLGRKVMTNLDSILKSRDINLPAKVCLVKTMVFPVVMYGCESWTVKKPEHERIGAFELWCWRRILKSHGLQGDQSSPS